MAEAAGRQHHRARGKQERTCSGIAGLAQLKAGDRAVLGQQRFGDETFDQSDRRRAAHGLAQRRDDRGSGPVAAHMHDAPRRMRGLAADRELAFEVAVERHAIGEQVMDAWRGLARDPERDRFVDETAADGDGVSGVRLRAIAFGHGRSDAALRPGGRRALSERRGRDQRYRPRRELQCTEQSGEAAADDDDVIGAAGEIVDVVLHASLSILQIDHPLDRTPRAFRERGIDRDLLAKREQAVQNVGERDALHVRAEIAGAKHLHVRQLGADIVGHRAFRDHDQPPRPPLAHPVDHVRGRAGEVGFRQHVRRTFGMRDDLHGRIGLAIGAQLLAR